MDVLKQCINPNLADVDRPLLARFIGVAVNTSLRRNHYVRVQYQNYGIPSPELIDRLEPNNYSLTAYYMPDAHEITEVYLYQGDTYICEARLIRGFNEAMAEQTDDDKLEYQRQAKYISKFDSMVKHGSNDKVAKVQIIEKAPQPKPIAADVIVEDKPIDDWADIDLNYKPTRDPLADL